MELSVDTMSKIVFLKNKIEEMLQTEVTDSQGKALNLKKEGRGYE
jgi:hypothetical protein